MKKTVCFLGVLLGLVLACAGGLAAARAGNYSLVVNHERVLLDGESGYVYKSGKALLIPVKAVCGKLGYAYEEKGGSKGCVIERPDGVKVALRAGSPYVQVGGKKYALRTRNILQKGGQLTSDVKVMKYLMAGFKNYSASQARAQGYPAGALVIANDGDLSLPNVTPSPDTLPEQLRQAAENASQIVGVEYLSGSRAKLTLYEKINNKWLEQYSTNAFVGKNGIGKTKEGDGKTPAGTFNLTTPFGILSDPGCKIKGYVKTTKYHYWCCTSTSKYYNKLVDIRNVDYTPTSMDERLASVSPYYNYALFIDYNAQGQPGAGSAIFLHCMGSNKSTSGCIAIAQSVMKSLLVSLDKGAKIVIY